MSLIDILYCVSRKILYGIKVVEIIIAKNILDLFLFSQKRKQMLYHLKKIQWVTLSL